MVNGWFKGGFYVMYRFVWSLIKTARSHIEPFFLYIPYTINVSELHSKQFKNRTEFRALNQNQYNWYVLIDLMLLSTTFSHKCSLNYVGKIDYMFAETVFSTTDWSKNRIGRHSSLSAHEHWSNIEKHFGWPSACKLNYGGFCIVDNTEKKLI